MSGAEAAWACVVEAKVVYAAIHDGRLPAEPEDPENGLYRWRILRSDVERFATELE